MALWVKELFVQAKPCNKPDVAPTSVNPTHLHLFEKQKQENGPKTQVSPSLIYAVQWQKQERPCLSKGKDVEHRLPTTPWSTSENAVSSNEFIVVTFILYPFV